MDGLDNQTGSAANTPVVGGTVYYFWRGVYVLIFVPTVFGNSLIIFSIFKKSYLKSKFHVLIGNLAVADLIVGVVLIPYDFLGDFFTILNRNKYLCMTKLALLGSCLGASCFGLLIVSLERLLTLSYPLKHPLIFTWRRMKILIGYEWITVIMLNLLPLMGWHKSEEPTTNSCLLDRWWTKEYKLLMNSLSSSVLLATFISYIKIARIAIKAGRRHCNTSTTQWTRRSVRSNQKTKLMLIVFGVFAVCWCPHVVCCVVMLFYKEPVLMFQAQKTTITLGIFNSALNWIIYGLGNNEFRKAFKTLLTGCVCRKQELV